MNGAKKMMEKMKKALENKWTKALVCLIVPLLFAIIVEGLSGLPLRMNREFIQKEIALEELVTERFVLEQGALVATADDGILGIEFEESTYINKLYLYYTSYGPIEMEITYIEDRGGGEIAIMTFQRNANMMQEFTAITFGKRVLQMKIDFEGEFDSDDLVISGIQINNEIRVSPWRLFFSFSVAFLAFLIILYKSEFVGKEQRFFVVAGLLMGLVAITSMPPHTSGWDEEIHFQRAYSLSNLVRLQGEFYVSPTVILIAGIHIETWPWHYPNTMEDRRHLVEIYNELDTDEYRGNPEHYRRMGSGFVNPVSFVLLAPAYLAQAVGIATGRILQLPFSLVYTLGRVGNLLFYLAIGFFAIKRSIVGKKVMMALLLMPTPLFLATVYSYDAAVNAFIALGIACILREIYGKEKKISYFNVGLFVFSIVVASMPKAIFAPLLLLGLLIPKEKLPSVKHLRVMRLGIIGGTLILLATFILPALIDTLFATAEGAQQIADHRGGDTNVPRQIRHIFSQPFSYGLGMLQIMYGTIVEFSIGPSAMGQVGYGFTNSVSGAPAILLTAVTFTERGFIKIKKGHKAFIGIILFAISALIWTALYLSFSPVGHPYIVGVQGRYFIPIVLVGLLLINGSAIEYKSKEKTYNTILFAFITLITMTSFYATFVMNNV